MRSGKLISYTVEKRAPGGLTEGGREGGKVGTRRWKSAVTELSRPIFQIYATHYSNHDVMSGRATLHSLRPLLSQLDR